MVLFPLPEGPTMAVVLPAGIRRLTPARTLISGREGYVKLTFVRTMSPSAETGSGGFFPSVDGAGRSMVAKRAVAAREERRMAVRGGERVVRAVVVIITVMRTLEALVW